LNTDLCAHLISSGNLDKLVLVNTPDAHAFVCTQCACDWTEGVLLSQPIHATARALVFTACEHDEGLCRTCLEAFRDALTARWSRAMTTDKRMANRIMSLRRLLAKHYDKGAAPAAHTAQRQERQQYPGMNRFGRNLEAAMAGQQWQANRAQRLATLAPPPVAVAVVSPIQAG